MKIHKSTSKKKPVYLRVEIFLICNGYAEIITNPEGFLAHGTIRYYFEMENGNITEIHYSEVSKRIYTFRNISQKEFSENIKRTKTQYTNDNFQYQLIELD